ncbi:toxin-activating lysine-acyltransferase [Roseisalinus antarcticus]|uniref:RTX toxin-activating lysine-acyltransferase n=1 Tax=Roseisalinus antarcticus TaxID=254357 RepID=A0A1Y5SZ66_9RHOB|nr:toxin-activating lysine-acyltransferase [Roseisalinus antarcticus]SLN52089.1 RTX toxin acyltransferase family protein [Roseisalinus antarcticus]
MADELTEGASDKNGDAPSKQDLEHVGAIRERLRTAFGQVVLAMMVLPRYRHLSLAELQRVLLDPLVRDRVALAQTTEGQTPIDGAAGAVIWASVSEQVDAKIREQIRAGVFPLRLEPDDWTSGEINWLLDVIAPSQDMTRRVMANMKKLTKGGDLRIHPLVTGMIGADTLREMGAQSVSEAEAEK